MQFVLGPFVHAHRCALDGTWRQVRETDGGLTQVLLLPISLGAGIAVLVLWLLCAPFTISALDAPVLVAGFAILVPLHEFMHAVSYPSSSGTGSLAITVWPSRLLFCAGYDGEVSRARYIGVQAAPLLAVSLGPIALCAVLGIESAHLALISLLNALASGGDLLAIILVLAQVPEGAVIRQLAWRTVWRRELVDPERSSV
jgi:hypothetical protein